MCCGTFALDWAVFIGAGVDLAAARVAAMCEGDCWRLDWELEGGLSESVDSEVLRETLRGIVEFLEPSSTPLDARTGPFAISTFAMPLL